MDPVYLDEISPADRLGEFERSEWFTSLAKKADEVRPRLYRLVVDGEHHALDHVVALGAGKDLDWSTFVHLFPLFADIVFSAQENGELSCSATTHAFYYLLGPDLAQRFRKIIPGDLPHLDIRNNAVGYRDVFIAARAAFEEQGRTLSRPSLIPVPFPRDIGDAPVRNGIILNFLRDVFARLLSFHDLNFQDILSFHHALTTLPTTTALSDLFTANYFFRRQLPPVIPGINGFGLDDLSRTTAELTGVLAKHGDNTTPFTGPIDMNLIFLPKCGVYFSYAGPHKEIARSIPPAAFNNEMPRLETPPIANPQPIADHTYPFPPSTPRYNPAIPRAPRSDPPVPTIPTRPPAPRNSSSAQSHPCTCASPSRNPNRRHHHDCPRAYAPRNYDREPIRHGASRPLTSSFGLRNSFVYNGRLYRQESGIKYVNTNGRSDRKHRAQTGLEILFCPDGFIVPRGVNEELRSMVPHYVEEAFLYTIEAPDGFQHIEIPLTPAQRSQSRVIVTIPAGFKVWRPLASADTR